MKRYTTHASFALALGLGVIATLTLLWLLGGDFLMAKAQGTDEISTYYVAPGGSCGGMTPCYATVQAAVNAADDPGDVIKVAAGTYSDVNHGGGLAQVVYVDKTVTIRGGYTLANWTTPDPDANLTTLDAQRYGRVLYVTGDITPTIEGLRITGGDAAGLGSVPVGYGCDSGGGIYVVTATATLSNNQIFVNVAQCGGGIYLNNGPATLIDNVIHTNTAYAGGIGSGGGGGIYSYKSAATLSGNEITSNQAATSGGGLHLNQSDVTLTGNTVADNTSSIGGGILLNSCIVDFSGNVIASNRAEIDGGGVAVAGGDGTLSGNTIVSNTAANGGGVYLASDGPVLRDNMIAANTATNGGGLYLRLSNVTLLNNTVVSNTSLTFHGGGLYLYGSDATLSGNAVLSNTAAFYGGGLYLYRSAATLSGNVIISNTAATGGGASLRESPATLSGNTISGNTANGTSWWSGGGGLELGESAATLINNIIADNHTNGLGSGLRIRGSAPHLLHNTVARNSGGDGSGICVTKHVGDREYSTVALTNTILVSHTVGITIASGSTAWLEATLWGSSIWANETDWAGDGVVVTGTINLWGDPAFVNPDVGDYHIGFGSVAIDKGIDAAVASDMDGQARPHYDGHDLGADEWWLLTVTKAATPATGKPGEAITFTLTLTNLAGTAMTVHLTDALPTQVGYLGPLNYSDGEGGYASGVVTWTGTVHTATPTLITWTVQIASDSSYSITITNTAIVSDTFGFFQTDPALILVPPSRVYLPVVLQQYP